METFEENSKLSMNDVTSAPQTAADVEDNRQ
jgi:hypothetical protein